MSCSSHCHGTDIQEAVGTQLSVGCAIVLFALSVGQVTPHGRKEFISQQQTGSGSFYRSYQLDKGLRAAVVLAT